MPEQGLEGVRQDFVRAVADEDLARFDTMAEGDRRLEQVGVGVRVEAQARRVVAEPARIAASTAGDGGKGFSLVLSLIRLATFGCSPGT